MVSFFYIVYFINQMLVLKSGHLEVSITIPIRLKMNKMLILTFGCILYQIFISLLKVATACPWTEKYSIIMMHLNAKKLQGF